MAVLPHIFVSNPLNKNDDPIIFGTKEFLRNSGN